MRDERDERISGTKYSAQTIRGRVFVPLLFLLNGEIRELSVIIVVRRPAGQSTFSELLDVFKMILRPEDARYPSPPPFRDCCGVPVVAVAPSLSPQRCSHVLTWPECINITFASNATLRTCCAAGFHFHPASSATAPDSFLPS